MRPKKKKTISGTCTTTSAFVFLKHECLGLEKTRHLYRQWGEPDGKDTQQNFFMFKSLDESTIVIVWIYSWSFLVSMNMLSFPCKLCKKNVSEWILTNSYSYSCDALQ